MWALCSFCFSAQIDAIYHMITGPEWRPTDNCRFSGLVLFPLWIPSSINKKIVSPNQHPNQVHGLSVPSLILYGLTYVVKKGVYCTSSDQHSPDHLNQGSVGYKYLKLFQSRPQVLSTCCSLFSKHFSPRCPPDSIHHLYPVFAQISPSQDDFYNHTTWLPPLTPHHTLPLFLLLFFHCIYLFLALYLTCVIYCFSLFHISAQYPLEYKVPGGQRYVCFFSFL